MVIIFLVVVALVVGYFIGITRKSERSEQNRTELDDRNGEGYSKGYYQAIKDVRLTAKILNDDGEGAPVDKVLTTLMGQADTPQYEALASDPKSESGKDSSDNKVVAAEFNKARLRKSVSTVDVLPNVTLVVGAVLILASAGLFTAIIDQPVITSLILMVGVAVFFALAMRFTKDKNYVPAGVTLLGLSIALTPISLSPIPGMSGVSQWIVTSLVATAMLAYVSRYRSFTLIPYATTLAFFSLVMSIARGLTDDAFWSFVAVIVVSMVLYLVRIKKPLYISMKFDTPAVLSTSWIPLVMVFVSLAYSTNIGIEKLHIILALVVAYYLTVWISSSRYVHELIAKFVGVILLSSITYEHIASIGDIYTSSSFMLIGLAMVVSSLVGWKRLNEKRYIFPYEVAWMVTGFALLWYAYALSAVSAGSYIFAAVIALLASALSILTVQVSKRIWFSVNAIFALAMAVVSLSQWFVVLAGSWDLAYFITACLMAAIGGLVLWLYTQSKGLASYIAASTVLFFGFLSYVYLLQTGIDQFRLPEVLVAILGYVVAKRQGWPFIYIISNCLLFLAAVQFIQPLGIDKYGMFTLLGVLVGVIALSLLSFAQRESVRKWTLTSIVLISLPAYLAVKASVMVPGSYDILKYITLLIIAIGTMSAHMLYVRPGAVKGVKLAHEVTAIGVLILLIEFIRLIDISGNIHQTVYAHLIAGTALYSSLMIYKGSQYGYDKLVRQVVAAIIVSVSMAAYALTGSALGQILFLVEHALILAVGMKLQIRWVVYWASIMLVVAALWIFRASATVMLFLVGVGLIAFVIKSISKDTK